MNTQCKLIAAMSLCASIAVPGLSFGALIDRGGGSIYDSDLNITWLANASYGAGSSYDLADGTNDGKMTWQNANDWVDSLAFYDGETGEIVKDWRLPNINFEDYGCDNYTIVHPVGFNCTLSNMGHLFYNEVGGTAGSSLESEHNASYDLFSNIQSQYYWSTQWVSYDSYSWVFNMGNGRQETRSINDNYTYFVWAVHPGDVTVNAVPIPAAAWLFGSGLLGLIGVARKKAA